MFKLDFFIENYYKMCAGIIMADPVVLMSHLKIIVKYNGRKALELLFQCLCKKKQWYEVMLSYVTTNNHQIY